MKHNFLAVTLIFFIAFDAFAAIRPVTQNDNVTNILNGASAGDTIKFFPGTYKVNIVLGNKNLILEGADTKNTILRPADTSKAIIEINGASNSRIQNFTFLSADTGILATDSNVNLSLQNNVFRLGSNSTALRLGENISGNLTNNTFYGNKTHILNDSVNLAVKNNIFASFDTLISGTLPNIVSFNCIDQTITFFEANNTTNTQATFVNTEVGENDFHLQDDSNCTDLNKDDNNYDDAGAYGGTGFDKTPTSIPISTINKEDVNAIIVQWQASKDYQVAGYKVYYHTSPLYAEAQNRYLNLDDRSEILSVIDAEKDLSLTINNLSTQTQQVIAPSLTGVLPGKNTLTASWTAVENATSYTLYYEAENESAIAIDVGNVTTYKISELRNGLVYTIWLEANNQLSYYFQVAAYIDNAGDEFAESFFTQQDEKLDIGEPIISGISNKISIQPESIVAYPALPNEGCFIATAAFGYYSADQVQTLRQFRDDYLLTNAVGQRLVDRYYHYGPHAAAVIETHAWLKPITRALLYPLIIVVEWLEKIGVGVFIFTSVFFMLFLFAIKQQFFTARYRAKT